MRELTAQKTEWREEAGETVVAEFKEEARERAGAALVSLVLYFALAIYRVS